MMAVQSISDEEVRRNRAVYEEVQARFLKTFNPERCDATRTDFQALDRDYSNWLRAVRLSDWLPAARIAQGLFAYLHTRGMWQEIESIWSDLLTDPPAEVAYDRHQAGLLHQLGIITSNRGELERAEECFRRCVELARKTDWTQLEANTLHQLATVRLRQGRYKGLRQLLSQALQAAQRADDRKVDQYVRGTMASFLALEGKLEEAATVLEDSLRDWQRFRHESDRSFSHTTLHVLGRIRLQQSRYVEARDLLEESLRIKKLSGDTQEGISHTMCLLGEVYSALGDYSRAESYLAESVRTCLELGDFRYIALGRKALGVLRLRQRRHRDAASFFAQAAHAAGRVGTPELQFDVAVWHLRAALRAGRVRQAMSALGDGVKAARASRLSFATRLRLMFNRFKRYLGALTYG